ncbi:MAG: phage tail tube protein [Symbiobacteriaceae bacterium]|nr:phage tail tube protein [Symbiobacteriaceae bacterium]
MATLFLKADELVIGTKGSVFFTIKKQRMEMAGIQKISAARSISSTTFATVGTVNKQGRITGLGSNGAMTVNYWMAKIFRKMLDEYEETGIFPEWDILIINEQGGATLGTQITQLYGCQLSGDIPLALLDAGTEDGLTIDINFSFNSSELLEEFKDPLGVGREG